MLFTPDAHEGLASGAITVTFRSWRRPHAKVGGRHKVGPVTLLIDAVTEVPVESITEDEARAAGFPDRNALLGRLGQRDGTVWRVDFHRVDDEPRPQLSEDEVRQRLERMGPWVVDVLRLIGEKPGVVSTVLAAEVGQERQRFKGNVRRLKGLGLTESLEVGYRLTPLGEAVLRPPTAS